MELALLVWFAGSIDSFTTLLSVVGCGLSIGTIMVYGIKYSTWWEHEGTTLEGNKPPFKFYVTVTSVGLFILALATILPSQKTVYLMAGAYMTQKVVQSETGDKVSKILNSKLDEYVKEIEGRVSK